MKTYTILAAAVGFVPWFMLPSAGRAEEPPPPRPLINLQFPGGTVAEYVAAVLKATKDINIVVMPEARDFAIPPLQLTAVDVGSAIELLDDRQERRGRGLVQIEVHEVEPPAPGSRGIFMVSSSMGPPEKEPPTQSGVWTISDLLGADMKAPDVLTAIQTAVEVNSDAYGPAEIKFHEATALVIGQGHPKQMETVEQVIGRLREGLERSRKPAAPTNQPAMADPGIRNWESTLDTYKGQIQTLSERLAKAEQRVSQLEEERRASEERQNRSK